jgi:hypothetical protein
VRGVIGSGNAGRVGFAASVVRSTVLLLAGSSASSDDRRNPDDDRHVPNPDTPLDAGLPDEPPEEREALAFVSPWFLASAGVSAVSAGFTCASGCRKMPARCASNVAAACEIITPEPLRQVPKKV